MTKCSMLIPLYFYFIVTVLLYYLSSSFFPKGNGCV